MRNLINEANNLDPVRIISAALERQYKGPYENNIHTINDPLKEDVDVLSFNQYIGWYDGTPEWAKSATFDIPYNKPVFISEFGGGALQGFHGDKTAIWTEEYQEELYKQTLGMLDKIPQFRGVSPWILADFRSPRRLLPDIQDGWNRKGLISETGDKKKAFYVLQEFYEKKQAEFASNASSSEKN